MIELITIKNMRETLGYPTDQESLMAELDRIRDLLSQRIAEIRQELWLKHKRETGALYKDGEFILKSTNQARVRATEEILEEEINAPMRDYYEQQMQNTDDE